MEKIELLLLLKYPLVSMRSEENRTIYSGFIHANDEDYEVSFTELSDGSFKVKLPNNLFHIQRELEVAIANQEHKNIISILDFTCSLLEARMPSVKVLNRCDAYRHILHEYHDFTNFYLNIKSSYLAHDLSRVSISTLDEENREHCMEVSVDFDENASFSVTSCDLPQGKEQFKKSVSLKDIYEQFLKAVEAFQLFFNVMDEFDKSCWVLDPEKPTKSCNYRRILIDEHFSIMVTVDPSNVSKIPDIKFLGCERLVEKYRTIMNGNIEAWDSKHDIFSQLFKLLGFDCFPQKPEVIQREPDVLMDTSDCCICFSLRLNDKLPDVICQNKSCEKCFHAECLYEWLMSVNGRRFFSEVVGLCPNCEKNISCPIPK